VLLTISTTHRPATDLGYLLHKNPDGHHIAQLGFGTLHVVYPEANDQRCTAALFVDVDPVGLVRDRRGPAGNDFALAQYVNDRPYATSSFLSVAIAKMFGTAMSGRSKERPALAELPIPLEAHMPVVPSGGGEAILRRLFEPLGYELAAQSVPLDTRFPAWGDSHYFDVTLAGTMTLKSLLEHLYVLMPVLDDDKHYWVGPDEVDKLLRRGGAWLSGHPCRELIVDRYLRHDRALTREALVRLMEDDPIDPDELSEARDAEEDAVEKPLRLNERRLASVRAAIRDSGARTVIDLGCGSARLVQALLKEQGLERIVGVDVSHRALETGAKRLGLDEMAPRQRARVELLQGSLTYRDRRLEGFDAAAVVEVVEHLDPSRLDSFKRILFSQARPRTVVMTTPNAEYNVRFETLPAGQLRHRDHRFEWTRSEFGAWSEAAAATYGCRLDLSGIGDEDPEVGCPTQMAVFSR